MKKNISLLLTIVMLLAVCTQTLAAAGPSAITPQVRLRGPAGILLEEDGTMYVADSKSNNVLRMSRDSVAVAGYTLPDTAYGTPMGAHLDGAQGLALFNEPFALAKWLDGIVVSDTGNNRLRLISGDVVRTLAGTGQEGLSNGYAPDTRFSRPMGLAVDDENNLYVADCGNGAIRKITEKGTVTTVISWLDAPAGLCYFEGKLYITDLGLHQVLCADLRTGSVTAVAGQSQVEGFRDGPAELAAFSAPMGVAVTGDAIYVADTGNAAVRRIKDGRVTTIAGQDNDGSGVWPAMPKGIQVQGSSVYVADSFAGLLFKVEDSVSFRDVAGWAWYADCVKTVCENGLMRGTGSDTFTPDGKLNRGMCAAILANHFRSLDRNMALTGNVTFPDVAAEDWYHDAAVWAGGAGIMNGWDGSFHPEAEMDRQSFVTALYQYHLSMGGEPANVRALTQFRDWDEAADYAEAALCWAVDEGVLSGTPEGDLAPRAITTRAQAASMLTQLLK